MTPIGGTMAELRRAIDDLREIVDELPHFANLRDGGNLLANRKIDAALALADPVRDALVEALTEIVNSPVPDHWVPEFQHVINVAELAIARAKGDTK